MESPIDTKQSKAVFKSRLLVGSLLVILVIYTCLGFLLIAERWAKSNTSVWMDFVENQLEQRTSLDWSFEGVSLRFHRFNPIFSIESLDVLYTPSQADAAPISILNLGKTELYVDLVRSFIYRTPIIYGGESTYLSLQARNDGGRWTLPGFQFDGGQSSGDAWTQTLRRLQYLNIKKIEIATFKERDGGIDTQRLSPIELEYWSDLNSRKLSAYRFGESDNRQAFLQLVLQGDFTVEDLAAELYFDISDSRAEKWVNTFFSVSEVLDVETSLSVRKRPGENFRGALSVRKAELQLSKRSGSEEGEPASVAMTGETEIAFGNHGRDEFYIDWPDFQVALAGEEFEFHPGAIRLLLVDGQPVIKLRVERLNLGPLTDSIVGSALWSSLLGERIHGVFSQLALRGWVEDVHMVLPWNRFADFDIDATVYDLEVGSFNGAPAGKGISGDVSFHAQGGVFSLSEAKSTELEFPGVYADPIIVGDLTGEVDVQLANDRILVAADELVFTRANDSGNYAVAFALNTGLPGGEASTLSLSVGAQNCLASALLPLVPETAPKAVNNWLEQAAPTGRVEQGGFIYNGSLRKGEGRRRSIALALDVNDATLQFHRDWPRVQGVSAQIYVKDADVEADVASADFNGLIVNSGAVVVSPGDQNAQLQVRANFDGEAHHVVDLLQTAPFDAELSDVFSSWQASGQVGDGVVSLSMPLTELPGDQFRLDVGGKLDQVLLKMQDLDLTLNNISGAIRYTTENNLTSNNLTGNLWGETVAVEIGSREMGSDVTELTASGLVDVSRVQTWLNQPLLHFTSGKLPVDFSLIASEKGSELTVGSTGRGVEIDLPAPFYKVTDSALPIALRWEFLSENQPLTLQLGEWALFRSWYASNVMQAATVVVSDNVQPVESWLESSMQRYPDYDFTETGYINLTASLSRFDLDAWLPVFDRYLSLVEDASNDEADELDGLKLRGQAIVIDAVHAFDMSFDKTELALRELDSGLEIDFDNAIAKGMARLPLASLEEQQERKGNSDGAGVPLLPLELTPEQRFLVDLDYLILPRSLLNAEEPELAAEDGRSLLPSDLEPLDVSIDRLAYDGLELGSWSFLLTPGDSTALVHHINGEVDGLLVQSEDDDGILWALDEHGEATTGLHVEAASQQFDRFLDRFEADGRALPMRSKAVEASLSLDWPGMPQEVSLESISGSIEFNFSDGQFYQAPEGATGLMKLLGLVNFDTLVRRIQLDFADVYKEGLSFDNIHGRVELDDRKLAFKDHPIFLEGPSSEFRLAGGIDLKRNTIDADLVATLPVANNLPWLGAIAGGLPGVAGTYVFTRVFGSQIRRLSSASYKIEGSLDNPDVTLDKLFENRSQPNTSSEDFVDPNNE